MHQSLTFCEKATRIRLRVWRWQPPPRILLLLVVLLANGFARKLAAEESQPTVLGVVAVDSLQSVRSQANWIGELVGSPGVAGMIDVFAPMVLGGTGLEALDETRPAGVIVAVVDEEPVLQGYVPATDATELAKTLTKALTKVSAFVEIVAEGEWVIVSPKGKTVIVPVPEKYFHGITDRFSVGMKMFPAQVPDTMRTQLYDAVKNGAENPLVAGSLDAELADTAGDSVRQVFQQTAAVMIGLTVDSGDEEVVFETHFLANKGSQAAAVLSGAAEVTPTVVLPKPVKADAVIASIQFAQAVTEEHWQTIEAELEKMVSAVSFSGVDGGVVIDDDPNSAELARAVQAAITELIVGIVQPLSKSLLKAVSPTGVIDGCVVVEAVADNPMPKVVLGMRVADPEAFVQEILPEIEKIGFELKSPSKPITGWQYHDVIMPVGSLTFATAEQQVFAIFNASEGESRLEFGDDPLGEFKPMLKLNANLHPILNHTMLATYDSDLAELGEAAAGLNPQLQMLVRPLQGGAATRVALNADCVRFVAGIFLMAGASENVVDNVVE